MYPCRLQLWPSKVLFFIDYRASSAVVMGEKKATSKISEINGDPPVQVQPTHGHPQTSTDGAHIICNYPSDPAIVLGFLSIASLAISLLSGYYSVFYPYKGKSVPRAAFFRSITFLVFFLITLALSMLAAGMLCWVTIAELVYITNNVHGNMKTTCSTVKSGLFGGGAFMALNAALFWLICLILVDDIRKAYFDDREDSKAQILTKDYDYDTKQQSQSGV
ncbi:hypothetical protein PTKIN_Ptkin13bG0148100 [Pterospermum kingtungense]